METSELDNFGYTGLELVVAWLKFLLQWNADILIQANLFREEHLVNIYMLLK